MSDQSETIRFLSSSEAFDSDETVETIETHGAFVFLCGNTALKLKRDVKYDYMDLSTVDLRRLMLVREIELNAPQAPMIYRDVLPVTLEETGLALGGTGPAVDWVLRMWRFRAEDELEEIVARGELDDTLAAATGEAIASYHRSAPVIRREGDRLVKAILAELARVFAEFPGAAGTGQVAAWHADAEKAFESIREILADRGRNGHVRRAHGDLHLRNLVLIERKPVLFDALEFDEELGTCDVLYDVAFLVMDLCHRGLHQQACRVLDRWLSDARGEEDAGLAALPLFPSVRAAIRAMVLLQTDAARNTPCASGAEIEAYLDLARDVLKPKPPQLVAIGGDSGTGKSTLAAQLAPAIGALPGAIMLSSDLERKVGLPKELELPRNAYTKGQRDAVYQSMLERAEALLKAGHSALLDATFTDPFWCNEAAEVAGRAGVPFHGLWLDAPKVVLEDRLRARHKGASDADIAVLHQQFCASSGAVGWRRLDATLATLDLVQNVLPSMIEAIDGVQEAS